MSWAAEQTNAQRLKTPSNFVPNLSMRIPISRWHPTSLTTKLRDLQTLPKYKRAKKYRENKCAKKIHSLSIAKTFQQNAPGPDLIKPPRNVYLLTFALRAKDLNNFACNFFLLSRERMRFRIYKHPKLVEFCTLSRDFRELDCFFGKNFTFIFR